MTATRSTTIDLRGRIKVLPRHTSKRDVRIKQLHNRHMPRGHFSNEISVAKERSGHPTRGRHPSGQRKAMTLPDYRPLSQLIEYTYFAVELATPSYQIAA